MRLCPQHTGPWGCKTRAGIQTGKDLGTPLHGAAYKQPGVPVWPTLQGSPHLSTDVKPKFWHCISRWFMHLARGRKTLRCSPCEDGTSVLGWEESLYIKSQLDRSFQGTFHIESKSQHSSLPEPSQQQPTTHHITHNTQPTIHHTTYNTQSTTRTATWAGLVPQPSFSWEGKEVVYGSEI